LKAIQVNAKSEIPKKDTKNNLNIPQLQEYSTWPTFSSKATYKKGEKKETEPKGTSKILMPLGG
jgi:hypothetical protein